MSYKRKIPKMIMYELISDRLNKKGILPITARKFTPASVQQEMYNIKKGKIRYPEMITEYELITNEYINS
jgi:hypothetical protein